MFSNRPLSFEESLAKMKEQGVINHQVATDKRSGPREIRRRSLHVMQKLGEGAFGEVGDPGSLWLFLWLDFKLPDYLAYSAFRWLAYTG